jgi:hypothetical protein
MPISLPYMPISLSCMPISLPCMPICLRISLPVVAAPERVVGAGNAGPTWQQICMWTLQLKYHHLFPLGFFVDRANPFAGCSLLRDLHQMNTSSCMQWPHSEFLPQEDFCNMRDKVNMSKQYHKTTVF